MKTLRYIYWKDGKTWLGYLQKFPDYQRPRAKPFASFRKTSGTCSIVTWLRFCNNGHIFLLSLTDLYGWYQWMVEKALGIRLLALEKANRVEFGAVLVQFWFPKNGNRR